MSELKINLLVHENKRLVDLAFERLASGVNIPRICRLVYILYPDFFLRGVVVNGVSLFIDSQGSITNTGPHHPQEYSRELLVSLLKKIGAIYEREITSDLISTFLLELESDFSPEYLTNFPFVIRIVTGNAFKRKEYAHAFGLGSVEFMSYEFQEIQGTNEEIILNKVEQLPELFNEIVIVDDTALEVAALDGFPGPYVKSFFELSPIEKFGEKLEKLQNRSAFVVHTVAVTFRHFKTVEVVRFPVMWGDPVTDGHSFDPYCYYKGAPLTSMNGWFRHVIAFWIKAIVNRISTSRDIT